MKNLSLSNKFLFVVLLVAFSCVFVGWRGISSLKHVSEEANDLVDVHVKRLEFWMAIREQERLATIIENEFLMARDTKAREEAGKKLDELKAQFATLLDSYSSISTDQSKVKVEELKGIMAQWWAMTKKVQDLLGTPGKEKAGFSAALEIIETEGKKLKSQAEAIANTMIEVNQNAMKEQAAEMKGVYSRSRNTILVIAGVSIFASLFLGYLIFRRLNRNLDHVVTALQFTSEQVGTAASKIANSSSSLSQASTQQAASLQETAASLDELTSMVTRNMDNSKRAREVSELSHSSAMRGKDVVGQMAEAINEIDQSNAQIMFQVEDGNRKISEITRVISEIGEKTKVINDIVFQTKLLSFNASVEAARAGEHGKGFAVVAEEVGNLAQMSGNAAKEISQMLEESIRKVDSIVGETKTRVERQIHVGKEKVATGTRIAQECNDVLDEIVRNVSEVNQMSSDISTASEEQALGVREINSAVNQLDQATQSNAASATETADAVVSLSAQAKTLKEMVDTLVTTIKGGVSTAGEGQTKPSSAKKAIEPAPGKAKAKKDKEVKAVAKKKSSVIPLKASQSKKDKKPVVVAEAGSPVKAAAGAELSVPSENDPRFQDI